jgi:hypothetical protein
LARAEKLTFIPGILERVTGKLVDSVQVLAAFVWIWGFSGEADRKLADQQYAKHGLMYESSSHAISSHILSQSTFAQ